MHFPDIFRFEDSSDVYTKQLALKRRIQLERDSFTVLIGHWSALELSPAGPARRGRELVG